MFKYSVQVHCLVVNLARFMTGFNALTFFFLTKWFCVLGFNSVDNISILEQLTDIKTKATGKNIATNFFQLEEGNEYFKTCSERCLNE